MAQIKVTLRRSAIDKSKNQKLVLQALGLRKINQTVIHQDNAAIKGMITKVGHLVETEKID